MTDEIICPSCSCPRVLRFEHVAIEPYGSSEPHEAAVLIYVRPLYRCLNEACRETWSNHEGEKAQEEAIARYRRALWPDEERAFGILEACGIPRDRARSVSNGIQVLDLRYAKQVRALRDEIIRLRRPRDDIREWVERVKDRKLAHVAPGIIDEVAKTWEIYRSTMEAGDGIEPPTTGV